MVWLNAASENGSGLYLSIHRVEEDGGSSVSLHGTIGDGYYEGEVLIEIGAQIVVTFADAWLDRAALEEFFHRVERSEVESALSEYASDLVERSGDALPLKKRPGRRGRVLQVKEEEVRWEAA